MNRAPLDPQMLSVSAQRAVAAGPSKMMAARGLMPLSPADQLAVLYQLSLDDNAAVAQAAKNTAAGLPEKLLVGTLVDPRVDPRILDFFGLLALGKHTVTDAVILNPGVDDETLAAIAGRGNAHDVDLIAQNEQRILRFPEIIAAMYLNRQARMSTIDRIVELAVRNNVRVPGLAAWDEIARSLNAGGKSAPTDDALFAKLADGKNDEMFTRGSGEDVLEEGDHGPEAAEEARQEFDKASIPGKIRAATLGNATARAIAIRSPIRLVAAAAVKAPGVTQIEIVRWAGNPNLVEDVPRYIAGQREYTKMYGVKVSLCRNPKAPIAEVMRFMPFLREKDLKNLARSRGVPAAIVAQARKLTMQRSGKK
jgi:hypothetical protein